MRRHRGFSRLRKPCAVATCLLGIGLSLGCQSTGPLTQVFPINPTDIVDVPAGTVMTRPDGTKATATEDGAFMTKWYMDKVAKTKIDWLARQKK
jgi:hypothetical protein